MLCDTDKAFTLATNQEQRIVMGVDFYNATLTGEKAGCLRNIATDCTHTGGVVIALQGNGIDRADTAGCNGKGWSDGGGMYTLNTIDRHAVMYPVEAIGHDERSTRFAEGGYVIP